MERKILSIHSIEESGEDLKKTKEFFEEKLLSSWDALLELLVEKIPKDKLDKFLVEINISLTEIPKIAMESGEDGIKKIFSLMKRNLQAYAIVKTEDQILTRIDLIRDAFLLIVEPLKAIGAMQNSIQEIQQEQGI